MPRSIFFRTIGFWGDPYLTGERRDSPSLRGAIFGAADVIVLSTLQPFQLARLWAVCTMSEKKKSIPRGQNHPVASGFKKVLVAIDGSDHAMKAFTAAEEQARKAVLRAQAQSSCEPPPAHP